MEPRTRTKERTNTMQAAISLKSLFTQAHAIAKSMRAHFASYRESFASALRAMWKQVKAPKPSREVKEAAKMIKTIHHFEGRNRKAEHKISWKLDQMGLSLADRQAARKLAEDMETAEQLDPRNFFSPRLPEGKLA